MVHLNHEDLAPIAPGGGIHPRLPFSQSCRCVQGSSQLLPGFFGMISADIVSYRAGLLGCGRGSHGGELLFHNLFAAVPSAQLCYPLLTVQHFSSFSL